MVKFSKSRKHVLIKKRRGSKEYHRYTLIDILKKKEEIRREFIKIAKELWKSPLIDKINLSVVIDDRKNMMGLGYSGKPLAFGDSLYQIPREMRLHISKKALNLPKAEFTALLKHEAIHIGYPRHDRNFREIAEKHNIPLTYNYLRSGGKFKIQIKEGRRYKTIGERDTLEEARKEVRRIAKQLREENKIRRMRIKY